MENISKSIYKIKTASGSGTGIYLASYNVFVTNYHVVEGHHNIAIEDTNLHTFAAKVVLVNIDEDLAILISDEKIKSENVLSFGNIEKLKSRDEVFVLGFPFGMPYTETQGIVSSPKQLMSGKHYIQTDAPINPGNSGGPLVNKEGEIIGITTSKFTEADNMGFAVPVTVLQTLLEVYAKSKPTQFSVQCQSCKYVESTNTENCENCGDDIDKNIFEEKEISKLAKRVEEGLAKNGINPVIARNGYEYWTYYQGSSIVRIYVYDNNFICSSSPMNDMPTSNIETIMRYLLSNPIKPYQLGTSENTIFIGCRTHVTDLFNKKHGNEQLDNLINLSKKADEMDNFLLENYGCTLSKMAKI